MRLEFKRDLEAEHQRVEVVDLFSMDTVVAHFNLIVRVPVKLSHPDGQPKLFPEQLNVSLYPGIHVARYHVYPTLE